MDCSPPGSSVHEILQARMLEWVAISFLEDLPNPEIKPGFPHYRQILYHLSHQGSLNWGSHLQLGVESTALRSTWLIIKGDILARQD